MMSTVNDSSQFRWGCWKIWQHQRPLSTTTDALTGPRAGGTVTAHNVECAYRVGLHMTGTHESSRINDGNSTNTTTSVVTVMLTAPQATARCVRGSCRAALQACHHATATQVVRVNVAALNATATVVGIRQNVTLGAQNKIGHHSWQRHHTQTGKHHTHASSI